MKDEWRKWAQASYWSLEGDGFWVPLGSRRQHLTMVIEGDLKILRSRVARRTTLARVSDPELRAWQRNRVLEMVGFRIDRKGVMQAETPLPVDVTRDEWTFLAMNLARAADRFEYVLSGRDEE